MPTPLNHRPKPHNHHIDQHHHQSTPHPSSPIPPNSHHRNSNPVSSLPAITSQNQNQTTKPCRGTAHPNPIHQPSHHGFTMRISTPQTYNQVAARAPSPHMLSTTPLYQDRCLLN
ncbi:hypothetical protein M0R45_026168 [Rubus argutus]|uniref:Uncharacterized protein n=1 Tax=Rubus argutus TaxID=59490 RepID=A0AAW1WYI2_RUBAR